MPWLKEYFVVLLIFHTSWISMYVKNYMKYMHKMLCYNSIVWNSNIFLIFVCIMLHINEKCAAFQEHFTSEIIIVTFLSKLMVHQRACLQFKLGRNILQTTCTGVGKLFSFLCAHLVGKVLTSLVFKKTLEWISLLSSGTWLLTPKKLKH